MHPNPHEDRTDILIIARLQAHHGFARALAGHLLKDHADADDATQEAFLEALRKPPASDANLRGWLGRVVRNRALQQRRSRSRREQHEGRSGQVRDPSLPDGPEDRVERAELHRMLVDEVLAMEGNDRDLLLARFFDGVTLRGLAKQQGIPLTTLRSRLDASLRRLKTRLDRRGDQSHWRSALAIAFFPKGIPSPALAAKTLGAATLPLWFWPLLVTVSIGIALTQLPSDDVKPPSPLAEDVATQEESEARSAEASIGDERSVAEQRPKEHPTVRSALDRGPEPDPVAWTGLVVDELGEPVEGVVVHARTGDPVRWHSGRSELTDGGKLVKVTRALRDRLRGRPEEAAKELDEVEDPASFWTVITGEAFPGRGAKSSFEGRFVVRSKARPPAADQLMIASEGFALLRSQTADQGFRVTVTRTETLRGHVVDRHERPVKDVLLQVGLRFPGGEKAVEKWKVAHEGVDWESLYPRTVSGTDGRFVLYDVPRLSGSEVTVAATPIFGFRKVRPRLVSVPAPAPDDLEIQLRGDSRPPDPNRARPGDPLEVLLVGPGGAISSNAWIECFTGAARDQPRRVPADATGVTSLVTVPRGDLGVRAWDLSLNTHPLFGQYEGERPLSGPLTVHLERVERIPLQPVIQDLGGRGLVGVEVRVLAVAGDSRLVTPRPEEFDGIRVSSTSLSGGSAATFIAPARFAVAEFRSPDIGRVVRPIETVGETLRLPRLRRVRVDFGSRSVQLYRFLDSRKRPLKVIDRFGEPRNRILPVSLAPTEVQVPESARYLHYISGGETTQRKIRLDPKQNPAHVHRIRLK